MKILIKTFQWTRLQAADMLLREVHGSLDQILYVHIQHQFQPVRIDLKG